MSPFFFVNRRRKRKRNVRGWEGGKERERERVSNVMVLIVSSTIYLPRYTTNLVCIHYRWLVGSTSSILNLSIFFLSLLHMLFVCVFVFVKFFFSFNHLTRHTQISSYISCHLFYDRKFQSPIFRTKKKFFEYFFKFIMNESTKSLYIL